LASDIFSWRSIAIHRRRKIALTAIAAAFLGAVLPVTASWWAAGLLADRQAKSALHTYSQMALDALLTAFAESNEVLIEVLALSGCSNEHIATMRRLAMSSTFADEVGYFIDGQLACTSWGPAPPGIGTGTMDFTMPDGLQVRARLAPAVTGSGPAMALHFGNHNVLVSAERLAPLFGASDIDVIVAYQPPGQRPTILGGDTEDLALLEDSWTSLDTDHHDTAHLSDVTRDGPFVAVARMSHSERHDFLHRQQAFILLPIGAALSLIILGNVYWLSQRQLNLRREARAALRGGEFRMVYQPIYDLSLGTCVGAEALIRWTRRDGSELRPDLFLPIAEEAGFIHEITAFAIKAVCRDMGEALRANPDFHVSVNLSAQDFLDGSVVALLKSTLAHANIEAKSIWLEITERALVTPEKSRETLCALRAAGHRIAIDDFGTGYSSLQYLQALPIDALKIDKSFVDTVGMQTANASVIHHIIELGNALNLSLVAEGIEHGHQLDYLKSRSVPFGQGYFFSKPLELADLLLLLRASRN
jgi:sensor c-di-GMP phosphodiesterase-like protein